MNEYLSKNFYGNTLLEWSMAFGIIIVSFVLAKMVYFFINRIGKKFTQKTKSRLDDIFIDMLEEPLVFSVVITGISFALRTLNLPELVESILLNAYHALLIISLTWLVARLFSAVADEYLAPLVKKSEGDLDDQLFPIVKKGIKLAVWVVGIIAALNNAGYDVGAIIAGLGIGGLAFALAAQDTVSNLFGGFTIFTDRPFTVNDRIQINGFDGTVVEVGIRSSRLKTLEGRIVTMPNKVFTNSPVVNVSSEENRKIVLNLGLTYDMNAEQIKKSISLLKEIISQNTSTEQNNPIGFNSFGDFSLGIICIYYIKKGSDILQTQTDINLKILEIFSAEGLDMAFPTQTVHIAANKQETANLN
ncbi:mechanosensitive ion channel family protein [Bacteriovoracaceae bacterium]|nr:mechanosensitive ion channel family protein [Bacteriovoracaceae bacterium]